MVPLGLNENINNSEKREQRPLVSSFCEYFFTWTILCIHLRYETVRGWTHWVEKNVHLHEPRLAARRDRQRPAVFGGSVGYRGQRRGAAFRQTRCKRHRLMRTVEEEPMLFFDRRWTNMWKVTCWDLAAWLHYPTKMANGRFINQIIGTFWRFEDSWTKWDGWWDVIFAAQERYCEDATHRKIKVTLPETNIAPENGTLEKEIPIGNHHF